MIILLHPRSTKPKNRRFPLAVLALAATLEGREEYEIVDGNVDPDPTATLERIMRERPAELLAVSVMPGPQMVSAIPICREFRARRPQVPIVWGGYFPTLYPDAALNAPYVDFAVRGQGEDTFSELVRALREGRDFAGIAGLSYRDQFGLHRHNPDRAIRSPGDFAWMPYHRLRDPEQYIARTFLGKRTAVHQASFGCPFRCKFCGVVPMSGARQKSEKPERTAAILAYLQRQYGIDSVQFYDNNFFLREADAAELADRVAPLRMRWWCEARIDIVLRYSDETLSAIRKAGCTMIFFGAESGSDWVLQDMHKQLTADQTLRLASRLRNFGIVPEFSFVVGNPRDPERDTRDSVRFIRSIKRLNPEAEIIVQHYTPTPHPDGMYGEVDGEVAFPQTPDEWASERWYKFTTRRDPKLPWLAPRIKRRIDGFDTVISARWPTVQDIHINRWGRRLLQALSYWRYAAGVYAFPFELEIARRFVRLRQPRVESL
jgi:anaerobic magnesium-protoporphyrin IX monomethyl ester cyclase